jgi:hypothetical protein
VSGHSAEDLDFDDDGVNDTPSISDVYHRFRVKDLASADWAVAKLARARARFAEQQAFAQAEADRTRAWLDECHRELDDAEGFFGGLLESYHRQILEGDERRKTVKLPSGQLVARKAPDRVEVADPDGFVCAHGFDSPLVRVKASPDLAAVKQAVMKDGEALPGVTVVEGDVRFSIRTEAPIAPVPAPVEF